MQNYTSWTGTYEFKSELKQLLLYVKEQIDLLIEKVNETDKKIGY